MAEKQHLSLRTIAIASAGACALTFGLSFTGQASQQVGHQDVVKGLRGAQHVAAPSSGFGSSLLPAVAGAGVVAAGLAQRTSRVGRRAEFAGGLTGSKLHGFGEYKFDPLNLAEKYPENLAWFREAELKHGRVAMLAFLGFIVPDAFRIPIEPLTDTSLDMVNAHNKLIGPGLGEGPMWWLMMAVGAIESFRFKQLGKSFENLTTENAGDLGFRMLAPSSAEGMESMKMKEPKNGRLAMLASGGILTQSVLYNAPHFPFLPETMPWA